MARLARFYGGGVAEWLSAVPIGVVRACMDQLHNIEARESLVAVERLRVGTCAGDQEERKAILQRWQRAVARAEPAPTTLPWEQTLEERKEQWDRMMSQAKSLGILHEPERPAEAPVPAVTDHHG